MLAAGGILQRRHGINKLAKLAVLDKNADRINGIVINDALIAAFFLVDFVGKRAGLRQFKREFSLLIAENLKMIRGGDRAA